MLHKRDEMLCMWNSHSSSSGFCFDVLMRFWCQWLLSWLLRQHIFGVGRRINMIRWVKKKEKGRSKNRHEEGTGERRFHSSLHRTPPWRVSVVASVYSYQSSYLSSIYEWAWCILLSSTRGGCAVLFIISIIIALRYITLLCLTIAAYHISVC